MVDRAVGIVGWNRDYRNSKPRRATEKLMLLDKIFGIENRHSSGLVVTGAGVDQDATLKRVFGSWGQTIAGATINEETCMGLSAFYAGVRLRSSTPAALPLCVYKREGDGSDKTPARDIPEYRVLHDRPNPVLTPIQYREIGQMFIVLWGRSLSYIERDGSGKLVALWPMHTNEVRLSWREGRRTYDITRLRDNDLFPKPPVNKPMLADYEVLDIASFDGRSIVGRAREQLGEAMAAQNFGAGFYGGGAQPYMALVVKKNATPDAVEKLRENWKNKHGNSTRSIAVLPEDELDLKTIDMPLSDAQFLESRQFYVTEIARWFGIPPHKLYDLSRSTNNNIEEQQLEWYEDLIPDLTRWEQELHWKLFKESERNRYIIGHVVENMLRGNIEKRYQAYSVALQCGFMNRNEVRSKENMNSMGEDGDVFMAPNNMVPSSMLGQSQGGGIGGTPVAGEAGSTPLLASDKVVDAKNAAALESDQSIQTATDLVLNGAQITAATAIVTSVSKGDIPRDSGIGQLVVLFNLKPEQAEAIMGSAGTSSPTTPNPNPSASQGSDNPSEDQSAEKNKDAARSALRSAIARMIHKEASEVRSAAKSPGKFFAWLDKFYGAWPVKLNAGLTPAIDACRSLGFSIESYDFAQKHCEKNKSKLLALSDGDASEFAERINEEMNRWEKTGPDFLTSSIFFRSISNE